MRIYLICLLLVIAPSLGVVAIKHFDMIPNHQPQSAPTLSSGRGEVLFFNATWCGPCRQMKPIVATMRRQGYRMRDIDVDKNRSLAQKYGIRGIPTFVFLENGKEVKRFSGGTSVQKLHQLCSSPIYH
jgi:thioredoxin-like negative regulator of GroEL